MIRFLRGIVVHVSDTTVVIDVGGIGFGVLCSATVLRNSVVGEERTLSCILVQNETGSLFFGFGDETERRMFQELLATKGIGGKMAIGILRILSIRDILTAVSLAQDHIFTQVPGVGKRTAERLCFELKNRLEKNGWSFSSSEPSLHHSDLTLGRIREALVSLGFSQPDISSTLVRLSQRIASEGELKEEDLLRMALRELQKKTGVREA